MPEVVRDTRDGVPHTFLRVVTWILTGREFGARKRLETLGFSTLHSTAHCLLVNP